MSDAVALLAVAAASACGTALARAYAVRRRLVDEPGARRSHAVATPRGGGAGPVIAILGWLLLTPGAHGLVALGLAGVALIGAWDDHSPLPALRRLLVHAAAGCAVAAASVDVASHPFAFGLVAVAVVVLVNVWNFMDGIDGIAASQGAIVAAAMAMFRHPGPGAAVAVACLAFLPFNFPRARIFLGDVGSGALGVAIAWLCADAAGARITDAFLVLLPLSAFLVDAGLTLLRRMLRRERWWEPHAQHLYQGLARRYGHARVTLAYGAWTVAASLAMLGLQRHGLPFIMASLALCYTTAASLWLVLQRQLATGRDAPDMRGP